jgi:hypothetical protein
VVCLLTDGFMPFMLNAIIDTRAHVYAFVLFLFIFFSCFAMGDEPFWGFQF